MKIPHTLPVPLMSGASVLSKLLGEVAIGITRIDGDYGLKVNMVSALPSDILIPSEVDGVPIRVEVTGPISKRARPRQRK